MKFKDLLDKKVIFIENLGDSYYWDYRMIVQIDKENIVLVEYDNSYSGWIPFAVESVDKEFVSSFFDTYDDKTRKVELDYNSTETLKDAIDFEYNEEYLDEDVVVLKFDDIKDFIVGDESNVNKGVD